MVDQITESPIRDLGGKYLDYPDNFIPRADQHSPLKGMRLSEPCPAARVIKLVDPQRYFQFNKGIGNMGHLLEHVYLDQMPALDEGAEAEQQYKIQWDKYGGYTSVTHLDYVRIGDEYEAHLEVKTTSKDEWKPDKGNRMQVVRNRIAAAQQGVTLPDSWFIGINKKNSWIFPPVPAVWTTDEWNCEAASMEVSIIGLQVMVDNESLAAAEDYLRPHCTCSYCYEHTKTADDTVVEQVLDKLDGEASLFMDDYVTAKEWYKGFSSELLELMPVGHSDIIGTSYSVRRLKNSVKVYPTPVEDQSS